MYLSDDTTGMGHSSRRASVGTAGVGQAIDGEEGDASDVPQLPAPGQALGHSDGVLLGHDTDQPWGR